MSFADFVGLFVWGAFCAFLVAMTYHLVLKKDKAMAVFYGLTTIFMFVVFSAYSAKTIHTGTPVTHIDAGEYKVAFVYQASAYVSLGIEISDSSSAGATEHIFLYQFPASAFDNTDINLHAKKLTVVKNGDFKKLSLR